MTRRHRGLAVVVFPQTRPQERRLTPTHRLEVFVSCTAAHCLLCTAAVYNMGVFTRHVLLHTPPVHCCALLCTAAYCCVQYGRVHQACTAARSPSVLLCTAVYNMDVLSRHVLSRRSLGSDVSFQTFVFLAFFRALARTHPGIPKRKK